MNEKKTVSLARALKEKNRLIKKINELNHKIELANIYEDIDEEIQKMLNKKVQKVDVKALFEKRKEASTILAELKNIIAKANAQNGISQLIYQKEEKSSLLSFIKSIPTSTMNQKYDLGENKIVYVPLAAQIDENEVGQMENQLSEEIYELQDKIDELNATVKVEITIFE